MSEEVQQPPEPKLYLLDIEGTVAPISFITEQLYPYAQKHFSAFVRARLSEQHVQADLALLAKENQADYEPGHPEYLGIGSDPGGFAAVNYLLWQMDRDRKSTALKSLQGKIWKAGFESGELKSVLFADVPAALQAWSARSRVAIYSSGSVEAQQLFFRHSIYGDLTPLISGYFDTHTGPKSEIASYVAIAAAMQVSTQETIFFSDAVAELDAARKADCHTRLVVRQGNARINYEHFHERIGSLEKISNDVSRDETTEVAPGNESLD